VELSLFLREGVWGEQRLGALILNLVDSEGGCWALSLLAALPPGNSPGTHWIRGWAGPRACLDVLEERKISYPWQDLSTGLSGTGVRPYTDCATVAHDDDDDDDSGLCLFTCSLNRLVSNYIKKYQHTKPRQKQKKTNMTIKLIKSGS